MDATTILEKSKPGYVFQNLKEGQAFNVGVNDAGMTGVKAIGTHELVNIEIGKSIVGGRVIVLEDVTSVGSATVGIQINGENLMPATAKADLVKGEVINFDLTAGVGSYAGAAALTVDMVVATAALTNGRILIVLDVVDVNSIITRG